MIRLTSARQALELRGTIPELAVLRMVQFEGEDNAYDPSIHGHILVIQKGDDISKIPECGPEGLLDVIDNEWGCYEYVEAFKESGRKVYEMVIALDNDRTLAVIIPDEPWLDRRLQCVLETETGGNFATLPPLPLPRSC